MKILGLACLAGLNPKLLAVDLILMGNRRPRLMFVSFLLGGMGLALTIGLLDVFVVHADAIQAQGSASAGLDLALGVPLLIIGVLLATGHPHRRRRPQAPAAYITTLHTLVNGGSPTAVQVLGVVGFVIIEFALVIIPFAFLTARPEATKRAIQRFKDWITSHARQLLAAAALLAGSYMVISGTLRLLS